MRYPVTSGSGSIGSNLDRYLIAQGHQVLNVEVLTYAGISESLSDLGSSLNYQFQRLNIAADMDLFGVMKRYAPDCVLHLAAESHVDRSIDGPGHFIQMNIVGTYQLLQASLGYYRELDSSLK